MENSQISHYRILRRIGRGGMGEVFEAVDTDLDRRVALKFIAASHASEDESLARFEREARAAAASTHPHIATLYAIDRSTDRPFLSMELLTGETLRDLLGKGPLPVAQAFALSRDVADALAYAHGRGVVHRDIKPENLMFDAHGAIKVTDFGLARLSHSSLTTVGTAIGTPFYMAPESIQGEAGAAADVFALGVTLYEMLAGRRPFGGDSPLAVLYNIANTEPEPIQSLRAEASEAAAHLVGWMISKRPEDRPTAQDAARELAKLAGVPWTQSETAPPSTQVLLDGPTEDADASSRGETHRGRRWTWMVAGMIGVASVAALGIFNGMTRNTRSGEALSFNNRGMEELQRGDLETARRSFEAALKRDPGFGQATINLGIVFQHQQQPAQAESLFAAVLRRHPRDPQLVAQARYNLGGIDLDAGAWESAARNLAMSFALDSSSARVYNNFGLSLVRNGRAAEALLLLRRGIERFPGAAPLYKNAGLAAIELSRYQESLPLLHRALDLDSTLAEARTLQAVAQNRIAREGSPP